MWVRSLGQEDLLEEKMANCSSILAWEWTEEHGRLQSMGSQRVLTAGLPRNSPFNFLKAHLLSPSV